MEDATNALAQQDEAKRSYDLHEHHAAEEAYNDATKNVFKKAKALVRYVKTVTMRAESLAEK